ncbi:MAG TPA: (2Fe-2S)-binding protein [Candidatus Bipolaricaulis sp.]|nr:(2Fe-2S)-binding protein [Candidatus Bipolaricaulis sp.]HRS13841.1 (2Fe-2S)-binding protein [Candidatus Bipolaricaulis sp.]HRU21451.1 (2Fe-2S)-binding protein [Candidatus Bipolaricaulis sp.]
MTLSFRVNGRPVTVDVPPGRRLLDLLREDLGLTGTKEGCGEGECGACTVLVDGKPRLACLTAAIQVEGRDVLTIEGLAASGQLHPLQEAFLSTAGVQCGFCTPGLILAAHALLAENPSPTADEVREYLSGNLCRCTGYEQVVEAVLRAAERRR